MNIEPIMATSLVSVIVPVYKAEKSIAKCIESILQQTYQNVELVLVDDGSPDDSGKICDEYALKDDRVHVIHISNGGVSSARNTGIEAAQGAYIAFVDSDDFIDAGFVSDALIEMHTHQADMYISGIQIETFEDDKLIHVITHQGLGKDYTPATLLNAFNIDYDFLCVCGIWCKLYRSSIIREHQIRFDTSLSLGEDMLFMCDYLRKTNKVFFSNKVYYHYYRGNEESLFSRYSPNLFEINIKLYDEMLSLMQSLGCELQAVHRMEALYGRILISCIYHEYMFCSKSTPASRRKVIRKVAKNPYVRRYAFHEGKNFKDYAVIALLKLRAATAIEKLFDAHYCKGN